MSSISANKLSVKDIQIPNDSEGLVFKNSLNEKKIAVNDQGIVDAKGYLINGESMSPILTPKAYVVFDGTGPTILRSYNVSEVSRIVSSTNQKGNYKITFTNPMPNANYLISVTARTAYNENVICNAIMAIHPDLDKAPTVNDFCLRLVIVFNSSASTSAEITYNHDANLVHAVIYD